MEADEYRKLVQYETWYWWYTAQRRNLIDAVRRLPLPRHPRLLDAGCGSGTNLVALERSCDLQGFGADVAAHAARTWGGSTRRRCCLGSINELPFGSEEFDVVVSVDVLGCRSVNAEKAMEELTRVLRPAGHLVLLVPAYQWMRSRHDDAVHSVRRFTRGTLRQMASSAGLTVRRATHRFAVVFPAIAMVRLARQAIPVGVGAGATSDLSPLPKPMNWMLQNLLALEQRLTGGGNLPFGSTILLVARKERCGSNALAEVVLDQTTIDHGPAVHSGSVRGFQKV